MTKKLAELDATAQADLVRRGEMSPLELVDAAIGRIEELNPRLNAVISRRFERAREEARSGCVPEGPFRGVPFLLKDIGAHAAGDPVHAGMRFLRDLAWTEPEETYLAAKYRAAGFVFLGKTNTPELGILPTTEPASYGPTHNPWDEAHSAGGSSGGAAAAVASGMVPVAHASDGGGSIRIPAAHCGLVGLKPSRGRNSFGPDIAERWGGFSVEHVVTRSVRDTAAVLDATAGEMPGDPYVAPPPRRPYAEEVGANPGSLRIGLMLHSPAGLPVHADCVTAARAAAAVLESLGHRVEESHPEALCTPELMRAFVTVVASSTARALDSWSDRAGRPIREGDVEVLTWAVAGLGRKVSAAAYLRATEFLHANARRIAAWWQSGFDLLLTPTTAEPPPRLGEFGPAPDNPLAGFMRAAPFSTFTAPFNTTGQPAVSLPLHWTDQGLPVGAQMVAPYGREDVLIRIAAQIEGARPWTHRRPVVHV
jgi:amidase